ncbi:MAG: hypothetical protein OXG74_04875 [Acidobacteria bacterium]|nr:hypothetical protein [Acidobacteriota bacterium]
MKRADGGTKNSEGTLGHGELTSEGLRGFDVSERDALQRLVFR